MQNNIDYISNKMLSFLFYIIEWTYNVNAKARRSSAQVDHYDDRKRPYTVVHDDVSDRNRHTYDRSRTINHPFGMDRITVVRRRVVYGEKRT